MLLLCDLKEQSSTFKYFFVFIYSPDPFLRMNEETEPVPSYSFFKPNKELAFSYLNINKIDQKWTTCKYIKYILVHFFLFKSIKELECFFLQIINQNEPTRRITQRKLLNMLDGYKIIDCSAFLLCCV